MIAIIVAVLLVAQGLGWTAKLGPVTISPGWIGLAIWA